MFIVTTKHGYEGESDRHFADLRFAAAYAAERRADPYVNHVWLTDEAGDSVCTSCGTVFAYDSATQESVCQCGMTLD